MKKNILIFSTIAALLIYAIAATKGCNDNKRQAETNKGLYDFEHNKTTKISDKVVEVKAAETFNKADIKQISSDIFELKNSLEQKIKQVDALVRVAQNVIVKDSTILKYYPVHLDPIDSMVSIHDCVLPPRKFSNESKNYAITGTILLDGVKIDSIELNNTVSFRIAEKKNGWFSKKETVVQAINSNPYFNNSNLQSLTLKHKTNAWNSWIKPIAFAVGSAILTSKIR
jgi:LPS sulfotransferase NodH